MNPFQRIMVATMLAASALAACGEAHSPEQSAEATPAPAAPTPAPTPAPVPTPTPSAPNPPPVAAPKPVAVAVADVAEVEIKRGPAIPAATLRKQVLALLDSLRTLEDMEHEHVESIFKVRMTKELKMRDSYRYEGKTMEGWNYGFSVSRLGPLSEPPTILIGLDDGVEPWTDQKPTYCTFDFEELAQDIVALGYERDARRVFAGGKPVWGFGRDVLANRAGFGIGVYLYYLDEGTESERACVQGFDIGGSPYRE